MTAAIEVSDFKKTFYVGFRRKPAVAARKIGFEVQPNEVFGFLGPNGSGKTTTIKALLGLIRPDGGKLEILGHPSRSMGWRAQVGYLPEHPTFYDYLTGLELVKWFGRLSGLTSHESETEAKRLLARVGLEKAQNRRLRQYSKGMLQRAGLAQALVASPKLLILDEPMTGLDPIGRKEIRELILELRAEGRTIFYSTHILPDVEMTCDRVAIVDKGEVKRLGPLQEILDASVQGVSVRISSDDSELLERLSEGKGQRMQRRLEMVFENEESARAFAGSALAAGAQLDSFEPHRDDLETIFVHALEDKSKTSQAS